MPNNKSKTSTTKDGDDEVSDVSAKDLAKVDTKRSSGNLGSKGSCRLQGRCRLYRAHRRRRLSARPSRTPPPAT